MCRNLASPPAGICYLAGVLRRVPLALLGLCLLTSSAARAAEPPPSLRGEIAALASETSGTVAVYYRELGTRDTFGLHDFEPLASASLIKVPILIALYRRVRRGELDANTTLTVQRRDRVGGTGTLQGRRAPFRVSLREAAELMITRSDNLATNLIIQLIGLQALNEELRAMGLRHTSVRRLMMQRNGEENWATAYDLGVLLERVARNETPPPDGWDNPLDVLGRSKPGDKLGALLPEGTRLARKGGRLPWHFHDMAVITAPNGRRAVVVVMIAGYRRLAPARRVMNRIGRVIYDCLAGSAP